MPCCWPSSTRCGAKTRKPVLRVSAEMSAPITEAPSPRPGLHWPSLLVAVLIMVVGTLYPPLMADSAGKADHSLAMALFWAMSAGFVRGVGFLPRLVLWRWIFSGWAALAALALALAIKLNH